MKTARTSAVTSAAIPIIISFVPPLKAADIFPEDIRPIAASSDNANPKVPENTIQIRDFGNNIIGGADGPTSVFVAWKPSTEMLIAVAVLGLLFCFFGLKMAKVLITINGA